MTILECEHVWSAPRQVTFLTGPLTVRDKLCRGVYEKNERMTQQGHYEYRTCSLMCLFKLIEATYKDDAPATCVYARKPLE